MENLFTIVFVLSLATLLGGMVFFPAVVAPLVFRVLDERSAGAFLGALFPVYHIFIIVRDHQNHRV